MTAYSHKVADVEKTTLLQLSGILEWNAPTALCEKLAVRVELIGIPNDGFGLLYTGSGISPLEFTIQNLSIPMKRDGVFLRVSVANEYYSTGEANFYANEEMHYQLQTTAWLRDFTESDAWPDLSPEDPLVAGHTSHCGP